jgi:hypothetical protein
VNPLFERTVAIVHAPADEGEAVALSGFLCKGLRVSTALESTAGAALVDAFEHALSCDSVVVLLSPQSVERRGSGEQWERAMAEAADLGTSIAVMPVADCVPPALLKPCPWLKDRREVKRWLLNPGVPPAAPDAEVESLLVKAADQPGRILLPPGSPLLARFVAAARADFEAVVDLNCAGRTPENLVSELCLALDASADGLNEANAERVAGLLAARRVLLALAELESAALVKPLMGPMCSLATTPRESAPPPAEDVAAGLRAQQPSALQWAEEVFFAAEWEQAREIGVLSLRLAARHRRTAEALRWADCLLGEATARMDRELAVEAAREKAWLLEERHEDAEFLPIPEVEGEQLSLFG